MEATIHLKTQELPRIQTKVGELIRDFVIDYDDLVQFLQEACYTEKTQKVVKPVIISETLPPGTVKYGELSDGSVMISIFYPEFHHPIQFIDTKFESIPIPNILFTFTLSPKDETGNRERVNQLCFVVKDTLVNESTRLYQFPYSNVYKDGTICYHNHLEIIPELYTLHSFVWNWVAGNFNTHGYTLDKTKLNINLRELFIRLDHQPFDYDILVETPWTFRDLSQNTFEKKGRLQ